MGFYKNMEVELQGEVQPKEARTAVGWGETGVPALRRESWSWAGWMLIGLALGVGIGVFL